jgi:hypothetical protein
MGWREHHQSREAEHGGRAATQEVEGSRVVHNGQPTLVRRRARECNYTLRLRYGEENFSSWHSKTTLHADSKPTARVEGPCAKLCHA